MLISNAYAQTAAAAGPMDSVMQFLPIILMFVVLYFLMIRPQQKRLKEHRAMVEALRRGDQVFTGGGIVGKVTHVREDGQVEVEIAPGVKVNVVKATVTQVLNKTEPASN